MVLTFAGVFSATAQITKEELVEKGEFNNKVYVAIQQEELDENTKSIFIDKGAKIKGEYADGTVVVSLPVGKINHLPNTITDKLFNPEVDSKIAATLEREGNQEFAIVFFEDLTSDEIKHLKQDFNLIEKESTIVGNKVMMVEGNASSLEGIASLPNVAFIDHLSEEPEPLCDLSESFLNAGALKHNTLRNLSGKGMIIGLGDGGELGEHIDFEGRILNEASGTYSSYLDHGDKIAGLLAAKGNLKEEHAGLAPDAKILTQKTYRIFYYLDDYYNKYDLRITNNSYGSSFNCTNAGRYEYYSTILDKQMVKYEDVIHVMAAGNSGEAVCDEGFPTGYRTVLKGYGAAKNVLTVGAVGWDHKVLPSSGKGPALYGRIKPEITSLGDGNYSTGNYYNYSVIGKTSAATANATGIATLLYERYKQLHDGLNPKGALVKAVMCNTADDRGNHGPDFEYGFGVLNAENAVEALENEQYFLDEINTTGENKEFTFDVAPNKKQLKVMLYWNDIDQPIYDVPTLINDLDIKIIDPEGGEVLPWVLDHSPAKVANNAIRGIDRINNIEQITLDNPKEGQYKVIVSGHNITSDVVKFVVTHTEIEEEFKITFPNEGQIFHPGELFYMNWMSNLDNVTAYKVEFSLDGGSSWAVMNANYDAGKRVHPWYINGNVSSSNVKMRVTALGTGKSVTSDVFQILPRVSDLVASPVCGNYVNLSWTGNENAVAYEIYMMQKGEMLKIDETTDMSYLVEKRLEVGVAAWFSVKAKYADGYTSRRANAVTATPNGTYPCTWSDDIQIVTLEAGTLKGRELTSLSLANKNNLVIGFRNAGNNPISNFPIEIQAGETTFNETVNTTIAPGATYTYTTSNSLDFTKAERYNVVVTASLADDTHDGLDRIEKVIEQIVNQPVLLPSVSTLDNMPLGNVKESVIGVDGASHCDFNTHNEAGYIKTFKTEEQLGRIMSIWNNSPNYDSELVMTRNLSNYMTKDVFLRLFYSQDVNTNTDNGAVVEIRGEDTDSWVKVLDLDRTGKWINTDYINLSDIINGASQELSTSTQLRFRVYGESVLNIDAIELKDYNSTLPVELEYFDATRIEENTLLEWKTASEKDNAYFEVQVAKGDEEYKNGNFITLEIVEGHGTTAEAQFYHYNDTERFKSGTRYYRLKQVDFNGQYEYSEVVPVHFEDQPKFDIRIFPNPTFIGVGTNIFFELPIDSDVSFTLTDVSGRVLTEKRDFYEAGSVTFSLEIVKDLPPGVYYLSGTLEHNRQVVAKILKIRD